MMVNSKFFPDAVLASRAHDLISRYERRFGQVLVPPVPVERIVEDLLDLNILWDEIDEAPGMSVLAQLDPNQQTVAFNISRRAVIETTPGLYHTILGHEGGHWEMHVDKGMVGQPSLPDVNKEFACEYRGEGAAQGPKELQANKFMGFLLMPEAMLRVVIAGKDLRNWRNLYSLRDVFGVTISALTIRLQSMGLLYIADDGSLHRSKQEFFGQRKLL